jgi:hypothetical protein
VEVRNRPYQFLTDIFIYRELSAGRLSVFLPQGEDVMEEKVFEQYAAIPATLTIPQEILPLLMKALAENGVKPPEASFVSGKLEATEAHLKDMRALLKLK